MRTKINGKITNALLDTGAGCSVIDVGTLKALDLWSEIEQRNGFDKKCLDASGNVMNIIGKIKAKTRLVGTDK